MNANQHPVVNVTSDGGPMIRVSDPDGVVKPITVDLMPNPTWPSPSEQADMVADAVRTMYLAMVEAAQ